MGSAARRGRGRYCVPGVCLRRAGVGYLRGVRYGGGPSWSASRVELVAHTSVQWLVRLLSSRSATAKPSCSAGASAPQPATAGSTSTISSSGRSGRLVRWSASSRQLCTTANVARVGERNGNRRRRPARRTVSASRAHGSLAGALGLFDALFLGFVEFAGVAQFGEGLDLSGHAGADGAFALRFGVEFQAQQDGDV